MLLQQQSTEELLTQLKQPHAHVVASISPQSIASLAVAFGLPVHRVRFLTLQPGWVPSHLEIARTWTIACML